MYTMHCIFQQTHKLPDSKKNRKRYGEMFWTYIDDRGIHANIQLRNPGNNGPDSQ